ncbi:MAG: thioredoxin domain-containing protein [Candidatus Limnocylindrales bacterium]
MTSNRTSKAPSSGRATPPADSRPAGPGRPTSRAANRAAARAGTRGAKQGGISPILGWTVAFGVIAVAIVAVLVASNSGSGGLTTPTVFTPANIPSNGRTLGNPDAPVTIDLYGDFRCSSCAKFTIGGTESSVVDDYVASGKAKLVWHDRLIIDELGGGTASRDAANAAWCAADQGKFWVMHDWLYANQSPTEDASAFTPARLSQIGKAAGLDMSRYQPCLDQGTHNSEISADDARVRKTIAPGTPTVYVDGTHVGDPQLVPSLGELKAAIDAALSAPASPSATPVASPSAGASPSP